MNSFAAALLVWILTSPSSSGHGRGEGWPIHMACSSGGLEVFYQSCDPLQDFGLSIDQCSKQIQPYINIRFGIILREDIRKLFLDIALVAKGSSILNFSYPICEEDQPKFSFCGRRKGGTQGDKKYKQHQPVNEAVTKELHNGMLFYPKEGSPVIFNTMDKTGGQCAKWNKPEKGDRCCMVSEI